MIIDCHGHYTTSPAQHQTWREAQLAAFASGNAAPAYPVVTDDEIRASIKFIIPHGGGAVPYPWGRFRGLAPDVGLGLLKDTMLHDIFFDTCIYHLPGQELLAKVIPTDNILFASEMIGAVRGIDPETGFPDEGKS